MKEPAFKLKNAFYFFDHRTVGETESFYFYWDRIEGSCMYWTFYHAKRRAEYPNAEQQDFRIPTNWIVV